MAKEFFSRHELKYVISFELYQQLASELVPRMAYDASGDQTGRYNIVSLYFDSPDYKVYYETRNKLRFRQKLRLRVYNHVTREDQAFFEIKQKYNNVVHKRRTSILLRDAYDYMNQAAGQVNLQAYQASNPQILREIDAFKALYRLQPEVIVSYDRQAFQGIEEKDLRVTFDYNLLCRKHDLQVEKGPAGKRFVDPDQVILEVKVTDSVPFWLSRLLSELECARGSLSKFCTSMDTCQQLTAAEHGLSHSLNSAQMIEEIRYAN